MKYHHYTILDLAKAIVSVEADGQKLKNKIHSVAVSILKGWESKQLTKDEVAIHFTALGKAAGYHGKALANWIVLKTPLKYAEENKCWYAEPEATFQGKAFIAARDEPFWEVSPPPEPKPLDTKAMILALLAKDSKKRKDNKVIDGDKLLTDTEYNLIKAALG